MPRPSNTRERRLQIVQAFVRVVARRGYTGATIPHLAAAAGLAPGLIHYHFRSKQELLVELLRHLLGIVRARLRRRMSAARDPLRQLDAFIDAHLSLDDGADRLAVACWQILGAEALHDRELGRHYRRAVSGQLRVLERILERGPLAGSDVRRVAAAILAAVQGCFNLAATNPRAIPKGTAASSVRTMARGLLAPPRAGTLAAEAARCERGHRGQRRPRSGC